ncbi:MAG: hybrid sensor histidine kinase/response regulator [Cyanobacteria bacterium P01_D01_bin.56]
MFIEDEELRALYRNASKEHLDDLEAGFLHLEKHPDDPKTLKQLLRSTHSLKGDSRMLGVNDVETVTHQVEDILSNIEKGERQFTSTLCDCLCQSIDAIRKIAHEAVTGEPANISTFHVLAQLMSTGDVPTDSASIKNTIDSLGTAESPGEISYELPLNSNDSEPAHPSNQRSQHRVPDFSEVNFSSFIEPTAVANQDESDHASIHTDSAQSIIDFDAIEELDIADFTAEIAAGPLEVLPIPEPSPLTVNDQEKQPDIIDTVRVEASKLDALVAQTGELVITKGRISQRINDIKKVLSLWENWSRTMMINQLASKALSPERTLDASKRLQNSTKERLEQLGYLLKELYASAYEDYSQLEAISNSLGSDILKLRRLPLSNIFNLFPRMVRDLAKQQNKSIDLVIEGGDIQADKRILEGMKDPLIHLMRNAIDHGVELPSERTEIGKPPTATITLRAHQQGNQISIEVVDDGRGLNPIEIRQTALTRGLYTEAELSMMSHDQIQNLIFAPGFSTRTVVTELSGRGVGLDVVRDSVDQLKGGIQVQSNPGQGCTFRFTLNNSLATTPALIVGVSKSVYVIPLDDVDRIMRVEHQDICLDHDVATILYQERSLPVAWLRDLLNLPTSVATEPEISSPPEASYCVVLKVGLKQFGIMVDELIDQQDILLKPHSQLTKHVPNILGATILGTGAVAIVLNPSDLAKSLRSARSDVVTLDKPKETLPSRVLLVEDSVPIRTQMRRILEKVGYDVTTAVDGLDGFHKLQGGTVFDAVVSDVEMPNLDGLSLTTLIRQDLRNETLPVILITTLAKDADKRRGAEAGANAYLTKGDFDQTILIETLRTLIN